MFLGETPHTLPFTISSSLEHKIHYPLTHVPVWNTPHVTIYNQFWFGTPHILTFTLNSGLEHLIPISGLNTGTWVKWHNQN